MKLVLLPGMDGTGLLFAPLLAELSGVDTQVIPLPKEGPQDYESLTRWVIERLPTEDHIILAESFSGAIAARVSLSACAALKGIVFVASFLSSPSALAVHAARLLPIRTLARLPGAVIVHRLLFLGQGTNRETTDLFCRVIDAVPHATLKARLHSISCLRHTGFLSQCPAVYIKATDDRLVSPRKAQEFLEAYPNLSIKEVAGPHFVVQANAQGCAAVILDAVSLLKSKAGDA